MVTACPTCTKAGERRAEAEAEAGAAGGSAVAVAVRTPIDARRAVTVVAAGTGVGFLTGLFGVGGGFVIVPALTLVLGLTMPEAIGTSLLVITINSAMALAGRLATTSIEWDVTVPFVVAAVIGVLLGGWSADRLDPTRSLRAFATLLVAVAVYTAIEATAALI
jgi:uncharacterized membrane protein YfcA